MLFCVMRQSTFGETVLIAPARRLTVRLLIKFNDESICAVVKPLAARVVRLTVVR